MVRENEIREAEVAVTLPTPTDAGVLFIGRIHTPWTSRMETPRSDWRILKLTSARPKCPARVAARRRRASAE